MKNEHFIAVGILCILLFYVVMNIFLLGGLNFSMVKIGVALGFFLTIVVTFFLSTKLAGLSIFSSEQIFCTVAIVHIIAIIGFWMVMMVTSTSYFGDISPVTGHVVFLVSIVIQAAIVIPYYRVRWLQVGSGLYLASYLLFSLWQYVHISVLGLLFVYVVLYNICVFSYGLLQYLSHLKNKHQKLETE